MQLQVDRDHQQEQRNRGRRRLGHLHDLEEIHPPRSQDRAQVLALRDLLNGDKPAVDEDGYLMWDRCYGLCNTQCWQWELACAHSTCVNQIMRRAGVAWPEAGVPDIDMPTITINLAID